MLKNILFKVILIMIILILTLTLQYSVYAISGDDLLKKYEDDPQGTLDSVTKDNIDEYIKAAEKVNNKYETAYNDPNFTTSLKPEEERKWDKTKELLAKLRDKSKQYSKENGKLKESVAKLKKYKYKQIKEWLYKNDPSLLPESVKENWEKKIKKENDEDTLKLLNGSSVEDLVEYRGEKSFIYRQPDRTGKVNGTASGDGLEQAMTDADAFLDDGKNDKIDLTDFQSQFSDIYNIFLQVGVAIAVIVGLILGIKFMLSSVEGKADVKKMLTVYVISCIVIFGSFGIWKIAITILQTV